MTIKAYGGVVNSLATGLHGISNVSTYLASKHSVVALTKASALEAAHAGVRVNSIPLMTCKHSHVTLLETGSDPNNAEAVKKIFYAYP